MPSYYEILGVGPEASLDEIKRSFRSLAMRHHPDKNKNSEESRIRFMKIVEAYEVLSDVNSRRTYDGASRGRERSPDWTPPAVRGWKTGSGNCVQGSGRSFSPATTTNGAGPWPTGSSNYRAGDCSLR